MITRVLSLRLNLEITVLRVRTRSLAVLSLIVNQVCCFCQRLVRLVREHSHFADLVSCLKKLDYNHGDQGEILSAFEI